MVAGLGLPAVEVHLSGGLPAMSIVGLPETAVKESRERVRSALQHSGFEFPARRITVNLAPADLPKQGGRYDLAIALGILAASGQIPAQPLCHYEFVAELALGGGLRPVRGVLPSTLAASADRRHRDHPVTAIVGRDRNAFPNPVLVQVLCSDQTVLGLEGRSIEEDPRLVAPRLPRRRAEGRAVAALVAEVGQDGDLRTLGGGRRDGGRRPVEGVGHDGAVRTDGITGAAQDVAIEAARGDARVFRAADGAEPVGRQPRPSQQ